MRTPRWLAPPGASRAGRGARRWAAIPAAASLLALGGTDTLGAQGRITGRVSDSTGAAIAAASAKIPRLGLAATSDSTGRYTVYAVEAGTHIVVARAVGFRPETLIVVVRDSAATTADFNLRRTVADLPAVTTSAAARNSTLEGQGFYERRQLGGGNFIDRAELARLEDGGMLDRAFAKVPGLMLMRGHGTQVWAATSRNQQAGANPRGSLRRPLPLDSIVTRTDMELGAGRGCYMDVYLNGALTYWMSEPPQPLFNLNDLNPSDIEAIEIYKSAAQMPPRFNRTSAGCGAIVIWLRTGG